MKRRFLRGLVYVLVAGQVLLSAPVVEAASSTSTSTSTSASAVMPCADSMPAPDHQKPCPCCPDGVRDMAACLASCAATVGDVTPTQTLSIQTTPVSVATPVAQGAIGAAEPPLKPPPIA